MGAEEAKGIRREFRFRTHAIRGLHENDFIMAAKVSRLGLS
jgi:pterin-4a-carbinolamine dehydratase